MTDQQKPQARAIAFYLPQYYPIPENDEWWGRGFTEWTNVTRAKPLFKGHHQPNLPADLGFYDLRVPEVREQQATLARYAGIEGFCYWHYWFGNGRKILERPISEVINSGRPDFPFCLCWANGSWSGVWHGAEDQILIKQDYGGVDDYTAFFYDTLPAFKDQRYIRVDGKPLFVIYAPSDIPDLNVFIKTFRRLANAEGIGELHMVSLDCHDDIGSLGFDGKAPNYPGGYWGKIPMKRGLHQWLLRQLRYKGRYLTSKLFQHPRIYPYNDFVMNQSDSLLPLNEYPTILPNWDNTPRSGRRGLVLNGSTPQLLEIHLYRSIQTILHKPFQHRLLFIKAWDEWAEGNYLEPDQKFGTEWLQACRRQLLCETK